MYFKIRELMWQKLKISICIKNFNLPGGGGFEAAAVVKADTADTAADAADAAELSAAVNSEEREAVVSSGPLILPIYCNKNLDNL